MHTAKKTRSSARTKSTVCHTITRDMTISQILEKYPKAAQIMQEFGLHCFGCSVNAMETLEQGILGHGMPESTLESLVSALNKDYALTKKELTEKGLHLSDRAALKIIEIAEMEGRKQYGIRLKIINDGGCCKRPAYSMDFEETAQKSDKILGFHYGVTFFIDADSFKKMKGSEVDYVTTYEAEGFKIENPNIVKNSEKEDKGCACENH